ncbi:MAG: hypothetical protein Tsb0010_16640 [Parvularculaceae bacterium]
MLSRRSGAAAKLPAVFAFALALSFAAAASASEWAVDYADSRLGFSGTQLGETFEGAFETFEAEIVFDPEALDAASVTAVIDMASAKTGDRQIDSALPDPDWFHVREFPTARFEATQFNRVGENQYEAIGTLTIRDHTNDVVLPFSLEIDGDGARMQGALEIDRRNYGVGQGEWESDRFVGATVQISVTLSATRVN